MRRFRAVRVAVVWMTVLSTVVPRVAFSAQPAAAPVIVDVRLQDGNVLLGQVVDRNGAPLENTPVALQTNDQTLAQGMTGAEGKFQVAGLKPGVYQLVSAEGGQVVRVWTAQTAPQSAQPRALVTSGDGVVRGQWARPWVPWVLAGGIAAAIAVPIAIAANDKDNPATGN
jgi:hypothetical protein